MTAPPARTTFRFYRGCTFSTEPIIVDNPDGTPVDISTWTATLQIWREDDDQLTAEPLFTLTSSPPAGIVIDGPEGSVVGTIDAADTLVPVDVDGEVWPFKLTVTDSTPSPDTVERLVVGYVLAQQ